jgi:hypothetical protein
LEPISLHPFDPTIAARFVDVLAGTATPDPAWSPFLPASLERDLGAAREGNEAASNRISLAFATIVAQDHPAFFHDGLGLTTWEARVDRGVGMLMRPPSRLFVDAGLDRKQVEAMPIRLDLQGGLMGGAWIPPRLMGGMRDLMNSRLDRMARRLHEAEYDPFALLGLMHLAVDYAAERNLGLIEAIGVIGPHGEHTPGMRVIVADRRQMNPEILQRIEAAITPPKKPGLFSRLFGRPTEAQNGHLPDDPV